MTSNTRIDLKLCKGGIVLGFRFFKRVKLLPGVTMNLSKSGPSFSFGPRGMKYTIGKNGIRKTFGIPGTGLYYTTTEKWNKNFQKSQQNQNTPSINLNKLNNIFLSTDEKKFKEGMEFFFNNQYDSAISLFRQSLSLVDSNFMCGYILLGKKEYIDAEKYLEACLHRKKELGIYARKTFSEQMELILEVTRYIDAPIEVNERGLILSLAEAYQNQDKYDEALSILTSLWNENPSDKVVLLSMCEIIMHNKNSTKDDIENILSVSSVIANEEPIDTNILYLRGYGLYRLGLIDGAVSQLTQLTRKKKDRPRELINQILYVRGQLFELKGDRGKAKMDYEKVYADNPNYKDVSNKLGL